MANNYDLIDQKPSLVPKADFRKMNSIFFVLTKGM